MSVTLRRLPSAPPTRPKPSPFPHAKISLAIGCCPYAALHDGGIVHRESPLSDPSFVTFSSVGAGRISLSPSPSTPATASAIAAASSVLSPSEHVAMSATAVTFAARSARISDHGGSAR